MKWGDYMSFWSMKENVDRCKKTIHKHVNSCILLSILKIVKHHKITSNCLVFSDSFLGGDPSTVGETHLRIFHKDKYREANSH